jgi:hypothetical protein
MNIRAYLKTKGLRENQIDDVEPAFRAFRKTGTPPEAAMLAALYVWGPSNRKRCRTIARDVLEECNRQGYAWTHITLEDFKAMQAYAIIEIHGLIVDSRCKDPQTVLATAVRTRKSNDPKIQAILDKEYATWGP